MGMGVTDGYVGGIAQEYYNARAQNGGVNHHREPKFAPDQRAHLEAIRRPLSEGEIQQDLDERRRRRGEEPDPSSLTQTEIHAIRHRVQQKRLEALASSTIPEPPTPRTASNAHLYAAPAPPPPQFPARDMPLRGRAAPPDTESLVEQQSLPGAEAGQQAPTTASSSFSLSPSSAAAAAAVASATRPSPSGGDRIHNSEELVFLSQIDPALLDEESLETLEVAQADVEALQAAITTHNVPEADMAGDDGEEGGFQGTASDAAMEANLEEAARILLGQDEVQDSAGPAGTATTATTTTTTTTTSSDWTASNPEQWINGFARHNVVKNTCFAEMWKGYSDGKSSFDESITQHSVRGNSRDEPTPYTWHCRRTEGCGYTAIKQDLLRIHELSCTAARVEIRSKEAEAEDVLRCPRPGCAYKTSHGKAALKKHDTRVHGWTPKACPEPGCDPKKLYEIKSAYEDHRAKVHSGRWPSKCLFPGCPETTDFQATNQLTRHLKTKHGLSADECLPYLPPLPAKTQWVKQACLVPTCNSPVLWVSRSKMLSHMRTTHKMKDKDAQELLDREARSELVMPEKKALVPGGNAKKRDTQQASAAPAGGKENEESHAKRFKAEK
jgi:uncharacterized C2H2 Zn-finger protein